MSAPRLEIDLDKILHNARLLVKRLARRGLSVTGVTKATLGLPLIARAFLRAGVRTLGDSHIENLERMRRAGIPASMSLIRSPMISQAEQVVEHADLSFNTELDAISALSRAAKKAGRTHEIALMVELGDLREGVMPRDLLSTVRRTLSFPNIVLRGIGTNLACQNGVSPDASNMGELSALADSIDATLGRRLKLVSGGNSGNLSWAFGETPTGRINDLRLGESMLLGRETLGRTPVDGMHTDAITIVAEVIEAKTKPSLPRGVMAQTAFGEHRTATDRGLIHQAILAIGRQDTDPDGLHPPEGLEILGSSSDHLVIECRHHHPRIGDEVTFQLDYSALLRSMTSPFVAKVEKQSSSQRFEPPLERATQ